MKLWKYVGKKIKVTCDNDKVFEGKCIDYTQALDNEPEIDSIGLETTELSYEIYENEIKSIQVI